MASSYILGAARTPIGKLLGGLSSLPAPRLGAVAVQAALARSGIAAERIEQVIMGHVLTAGVGQAPARQAALLAGLPASVPALTVNKVCGSGLAAVMLADQAIRAGDARIIVAGGMESMSRAPHLLSGVREGWKFGNQAAIDSMLHDGLWCATEDTGMGTLAEGTAKQHNVSRADQDAFALESHRRAAQAIAAGNFTAEIAPVTVATSKGETVVSADEGPRPEANLASLSKLRAAFDAAGTVTAGNASQISDGAAAVVVAHEELAREHHGAIKARIIASAVYAAAPKDLFVAPVGAIEGVLRKAKLSVGDIDLFELNEAFAAQCLACMRPLGLAAERVNVHGGAIALGHPIGASGTRVLVTLLYALADRGLQRGLAALCLGGGEAVAMIIERCA